MNNLKTRINLIPGNGYKLIFRNCYLKWPDIIETKSAFKFLSFEFRAKI